MEGTKHKNAKFHWIGLRTAKHLVGSFLKSYVFLEGSKLSLKKKLRGKGNELNKNSNNKLDLMLSEY